MGGIYLSIGTNLGNRLENIKRAIGLLEDKNIHVRRISPIYETSPWGFITDKPFLNLILEVVTIHQPEELIEILMGIEESMGRERSEAGYISRIIDIDIVFYGDLISESGTLILPHPRMQDRLFVLVPLNNIAAEFIHPVLKKNVSALLSECKDGGEIRLYSEF